MKRKVIQIAESTILVSIPAKWAKKYGLKKGDTVDVEDEHNQIIIKTERAKIPKKATIDARELEGRIFGWITSAYHRAGYDELEIIYKDKKTVKHVEELVKNLLLGFVIVSQEHNKIVLKPMAVDVETGFDQALRRAFLVTISLGDSLLTNLQEGKNEDLISLEHTNNQLTNFCQRILNHGIYDYPKTTFLFVICWNLEKIADEYKYILEMGKIKTNEEILKLFGEVNKLLREYYTAFYEFDLKKFNKLYKDAKNLEAQLSKAPGDFALKYHLLTITGKLLDFSSVFIGLRKVEEGRTFYNKNPPSNNQL